MPVANCFVMPQCKICAILCYKVMKQHGCLLIIYTIQFSHNTWIWCQHGHRRFEY